MKKEYREYVQRILELVAEKLPNCPAYHKFETDDKRRLLLWIHFGDVWKSWIMDEEFEFTAEELVDYIFSELERLGEYNPAFHAGRTT